MTTSNDNGKDAVVQAPVLESTVIDGSDMTEEEARIVAEGLEDPDAKVNTEATDEAARIAAEEAAAGAAEAETQRLADEAAANAGKDVEVQRQTEEQLAQQRREAEALAAQYALKLPVKPEPSMDFDKVRKELAEKYNSGELDIDADQYADKRDEITLAQADYKNALREFERDERDYAARAELAKAASQEAWNIAAYPWEEKNKHFIENPLRVDVMARSIQKVATDAKAAGEALTHAQLLERAGQVAMDFCGYTPPAETVKDGKQEIHDALKNRVPDKTGRTLGDVPNAGTQAIKGNEAFQTLDSMVITDLEEAVANFTADQTEKFLRDSPGANSTSRTKDD